MTSRIQQRRVTTANTPPANNSLAPGELYVEEADPAKLWVGVPASVLASGVKKLADASITTPPVTVPNGGTGQATLAATRPLIGNGTGAVISSAITSDNGTTLSVSTNLNIGTPAPAVIGPQQILVNSAANPPQAAPAGATPELWLVDEGASVATDILLDNYGTGGTATIQTRKARGTAAAPAAILSGDFLFGLQAFGRGATGYSASPRSSLAAVAVENWSDTAQGTAIAIATTAPATVATATRMQVAQGVVIGNAAPDPGQGALVLNSNATAPAAGLGATILHSVGADGAYSEALIDSFGAGNSALRLRRGRGTGAAITPVQSGDYLGVVSYAGFGTPTASYEAVLILGTATENWTAAAHGSQLTVITTPIGTTTEQACATLGIDRGCQFTGTRTNDNASAGWTGEYVASQVAFASRISLTTAVAANLTSISLTAGDWDVDGSVSYISNATTTGTNTGINNVSAALPDPSLISYGPSAASGAYSAGVPPRTRFSLAAPTTIYLVVLATFTGGPMQACGILRARRVR